MPEFKIASADLQWWWDGIRWMPMPHQAGEGEVLVKAVLSDRERLERYLRKTLKLTKAELEGQTPEQLAVAALESLGLEARFHGGCEQCRLSACEGVIIEGDVVRACPACARFSHDALAAQHAALHLGKAFRVTREGEQRSYRLVERQAA